MKNLILCILVAAISASVIPSALAKRMAPRRVAPVTINGVEYRAPVEHMGCVEAWDVKTGKMLWWRQIYVVVVDPNLEKDVQDVFIRDMKPADGSLIITSEHGGEYKLDLKSLDIQTLKGSAVLRQ